LIFGSKTPFCGFGLAEVWLEVSGRDSSANSDRSDFGKRSVGGAEKVLPEVSTAFLFPGQGSQAPGMLHTLPDRRARETLQEASDFLNRNVLRWTVPTLFSPTVAVQIVLLVA
jgi:hypothetical protein